MYPSPRGHPSQRSHGYSRLPHQRQYYMGPPSQMIPHGPPHAGYPPMSMAVTPGYHRSAHRIAPGEGPPHSMYRPAYSNRQSSAGETLSRPITKGRAKNASGSPKTSGIRKPFDPA